MEQTLGRTDQEVILLSCTPGGNQLWLSDSTTKMLTDIYVVFVGPTTELQV
jgi:hypothetical protein